MRSSSSLSGNNAHIYGLVAEVLDVLGAHVERRLAGHDEGWRRGTGKETHQSLVDAMNVPIGV